MCVREIGPPAQYVLRHEIGHLLGLVKWPSRTGLKTEDERYFTGPRAVAAYRAGGGDPGLPGVPLHEDGCRCHWHRGLVGHELMGPWGGENPQRPLPRGAGGRRVHGGPDEGNALALESGRQRGGRRRGP